MNSYHIKTNRIFTPVRKYAWLFIFLVALGGLWHPKLGLLIIPVMLTLGILGFFKGKYWCGNLCPHGSFFDYIIQPLSMNKKIPAPLKSRTMIIIAFSWFMYMLTRRLIRVFAIYGTTSFLDRLGYIFVINYLMVTILGTLLAFLISPRAWCSFCPMGTFEVLSYKLGKLLGLNRHTDKKVSVTAVEKCHKCATCARVCPMHLEPFLHFSGSNQFDSEACIRCSTCIECCPAGILSTSNREEAMVAVGCADVTGYNERKIHEAEIVAITKVKKDVSEFKFRLIDPETANYKPGQFILLKITDEPLLYRAYTISSINEDGTTLSIIVKKIEGGYATDVIFNTFKEGNIVTIEVPLGNELVVDKSANKLLLVANGIGITPFIPIVEDALKNSGAKEIHLIHGVRYENDFIYEEEFKHHDNSFESFHYSQVVSRPRGNSHRRGYVTDIIKEMDLSGHKVYICGTKAMTADTLRLLEEMGVNKDNIFREAV
ncbi:MAG: 4Fe-4S binding protein [Dethiobacter sp.]|nr:4Fe-4S binding protein [Dethiobacter sp.]